MKKLVLRLAWSAILIAAFSSCALATGSDPTPPTPKMPVKYPGAIFLR
jgi:hypothetical protein